MPASLSTRDDLAERVAGSRRHDGYERKGMAFAVAITSARRTRPGVAAVEPPDRLKFKELCS